MFPFLGSLISGAGSLIGGLINQNTQEDINAANLAAQGQTNSLNAMLAQQARSDAWQKFGITTDFAERQWAAQQAAYHEQWANMLNQQALNYMIYNANALRQDEYARMGIRMRVADAEAAGLHPLYALGAPTMNWTPQTVGATSTPQLGGAGISSGDTPAPAHLNAPRMDMISGGLGSGLAAMGQDIGRAVASMQTSDERIAHGVQEAQAIERGQLENEYLKARIANMTGTGPGMPADDRYGLSGGQGAAKGKAMGGDAPASKQNPNVEAVVGPGSALYETSKRGSAGVIPSEYVHNRIEDMGPYLYEYYLQNRLLPMIGFNDPPGKPASDAGPGRAWRWDPLRNQWFVGHDGFSSGLREKFPWMFRGSKGDFNPKSRSIGGDIYGVP